MNTARQAPIIATVDTVIIGGSLPALAAAVSLAKHTRVALISSETFLLEDICAPLRYFESIQNNNPQFEGFFSECAAAPYSMVPSLVKRRAEKLCAGLSIQLIYAVHPLGWRRNRLTIAGKFGLAVLECTQVLDYRTAGGKPDRFVVQLDECHLPENILLSQGGYEGVLYAGCAAGHSYLSITVPPHLQYQECCAYAVQAMQAFRADTRMQGCVLGRFALAGYSGTQALIVPDASTALQAAAPYTDICVPLPENTMACNSLALWRYKSFAQPCIHSVQVLNTEVLVAGGGTAGAPAALYSAENGAKTLLAEMNSSLGGSGTMGGVSAYWFGKRFTETQRIDKQVRDDAAPAGALARPGIWGSCDVFNPSVKAGSLYVLCREAGVNFLHNAIAFGVLRQGNTLQGVLFATAHAVVLVCAEAVIDTTGDADIAAFSGCETCYGSEREGLTYWASLAQYTSGHAYQNNFSGLVRVDDPLDYTRFILHGRQRGGTLLDHGTYVAPRETRHVQGLATVTLQDICRFKNYNDCIYTCFSNYDPKGYTSSDMLRGGVLPPQASCAIPLGAVLPAFITNLLVGGKAISSTHNAFPSLRMQPDLQHQGAVLGILAAGFCKSNSFAPVYSTITAQTGDSLRVAAQPDITLQEAVDEFCQNPETDWVSLPFEAEQTRIPPALVLATSPAEEVVPLLQRALQHAAQPALRRALISLLLLHNCTDDAAELIEFLRQALCTGLPRREGSVMCVQLLPDHAVMPEAAYYLHMLGSVESELIIPLYAKVCTLLLAAPRNWMDNTQGVFSYCEAIAYAAEKSRSQEFTPLLQKLLSLPELNKPLPPCDILRERFLLLRFILARALYLLHPPSAVCVLNQLEKSDVATIAYAASRVVQNPPAPANQPIW